MKEIQFIRYNLEKWQRLEAMAGDVSSYSPDDIADAYTDVTADLAFAYTHYPSSQVTPYLNGIASVLHRAIYRNRRERWSRLVTYWTHEVPREMYAARRMLLLSLAIFLVSMAVGIVSQAADENFCRIILGDAYVDQTLDNIFVGKPMDIYASEEETTMFLGITLNNVLVAFRTFALGILTPVGAGWSIFSNGVMMGCFMTLFAQNDLFFEAFLAVMLHGTLELSAIVVAGAAGLTLGSGLLFPCTYPRMTALRRSARRGVKIAVGTVPVLAVAAFIESFLTRHVDAGDGLRLALIVASAAFVVFYYGVWPRVLHRKDQAEANT